MNWKKEAIWIGMGFASCMAGAVIGNLVDSGQPGWGSSLAVSVFISLLLTAYRYFVNRKNRTK